MKNLEEFVKNNKKAFEEHGPSAALWQKIEFELEKNKKRIKRLKIYRWISVAAVFVVGLGVYFYTLKPNRYDIADVRLSFKKKEVRFTTQIEEMKDSLAIYAKQNPELYQQFTEDLKNLDSDYERLKAEFPQSPNQYFVLKAMVKNREMQLQVLNQQLEIINQVNNYRKEQTL